MDNRKIRWLPALMLVLLLMPAPTPGSAAPPGPTSSVRRDVTYCTAGGLALKMDIYMPRASGGQPAPVALYAHGGGWTSGDSSWVDNVLSAAELTQRGYLVASPNYRLDPQYKWPAQLEDLKCAVRYLRANAAAYHLDPARIGVWGESSGAQLASMLGLADTTAGFEGNGGYPEQSSRVQAVIDMCGPADFSYVETNPI